MTTTKTLYTTVTGDDGVTVEGFEMDPDRDCCWGMWETPEEAWAAYERLQDRLAES